MYTNRFTSLFFSFIFLGFATIGSAQKKSSEKKKTTALSSTTFNGLKFRSVGPALTSGRVIDIAVNPNNSTEYFVAAASGGVWKTSNAGNTYTPVFDKYGSYSIGCVSISPSNTNVVWVGTGENNNQRSVAYGDGVYKSEDGGKSWKNMGLKTSEHIGKILIHPTNSNIVYVSSMGPLWSAGGERGIYKTIDGGVDFGGCGDRPNRFCHCTWRVCNRDAGTCQNQFNDWQYPSKHYEPPNGNRPCGRCFPW
ncbi:MAG: hypothetical protein KC517_05910, partial [Bacteroidetes bacterium]|nr:hypothetical protein [Bacteroidota bacterium]